MTNKLGLILAVAIALADGLIGAALGWWIGKSLGAAEKGALIGFIVCGLLSFTLSWWLFLSTNG